MAVTRRSLTLLRRLRVEVGQLADDAAQAIAEAWLTRWDQLTPTLQAAVAAAIDAGEKAGRWPSSWQLARIPDVATAVRTVDREVGPLVVASVLLASNAATAATTATVAAEPGILAGQLAPVASIEASLEFARRVAAGRVDTLNQQASNRIRDTVGPLGAQTSQAVQRALVRGAPTGGGLLDRLRAVFTGARQHLQGVARTETLDAYRAAAGLVHDANSTDVAGWVWVSTLSSTSCPACWAMHGTIHPITEPGPLGHGQCRCARMPIWRAPNSTTTDLLGDLPDAQTRFRALPRTDQLAVMGPARLRLLDDGDIDWVGLAVRRSNRGWRDSYIPRPVGDLRRTAGHR